MLNHNCQNSQELSKILTGCYINSSQEKVFVFSVIIVILFCLVVLISVLLFLKHRNIKQTELQMGRCTIYYQELQSDLALLIQKEQKTSHTKSAYPANVSHEMRAPVNAVIGMVNIGITNPDVKKKDNK